MLLAVRVVQLLVIAWFCDGLEFSDDIQFQQIYAADPLQLLLGRSTTYEVFPPLFPLVISSIHAPLSNILSPFAAMRMAMCTIELIAWPLLWWIIVHTAQGRARHLLAITYIIAPMSWISTVIMCQDEAISLLFFAAVVVALLRGRLRLAICLCGVGVVAAKIYFLVPLVGLLSVPAKRSWRDWMQDLLFGLSPILATYALQAALTGRPGVAFEAFRDFVIPFQMSVSIWALVPRFVPVSDEDARRISAILALTLSLLPLLAMRIRGNPVQPKEQVRLIVAMILWVYLSFYHVNPEYGLIVVPGILAILRPLASSLVLLIGFTLPWAVNFFYGVGVGIDRGDAGRAAFVRVYQSIFTIEPSVMQSIMIVPVALATLWLATVLTWPKLGASGIAADS
jgi:hypothetical protein